MDVNKYFDQMLHKDNEWRYLIVFGLFVVSFIILFSIYKWIIKRIKIRSQKTNTHLDDFILDLFRVPAIWMIFSFLLKIYSSLLEDGSGVFVFLQKVSQILLIFSIGWFLVQLVRAVSRYMQRKINLNKENNIHERSKLTKIKMFEAIIIAIVVFIFIGLALMSFDSVKNVGKSLLASAGVIGIIVGIAAQRSVGQIFSGIQLAITQPIRIDDVVIVENEWGRVEEINITYIVIKLWDERRLVVPTDYFLQKPFQNWTRSTADVTGSVYLYVSYELPIEPLRKKLKEIVENDKNWDGRTQNIQVTGSKEWYKEIRILVSSDNSSKNWDLRVAVREAMVDFINENYPNSFAKMKMTNDAAAKAVATKS